MPETICLAHIADSSLADILRPEANARACSFCQGRGEVGTEGFAVPMKFVAERVWEVMNWLHRECTPMDTWNIPAYETPWVLNHCTPGTFGQEVESAVRKTLLAAMPYPEMWEPARAYYDYQLSWKTFTATVKYGSRFVFASGPTTRPGAEDEPPAILARFLDGLLAYVQDDLLLTVPKGTKVYRGRMAEDVKELRSKALKNPAVELGPAPRGRAAAGRLNAQGVGLFYGADDLETAVAEIALHSLHSNALVGAFEVQRPLTVLDFTRRPRTPSPHVESQRHRFLFARFVDDFLEFLTQPVILDGRERIDYTPTQVIAEYLRWIPDIRIDGIAWPSHLTSGRNIAYFYGPGTAFQSDPPTASEENRKGAASTPTFTLSRTNLIERRVTRSVAVHR